MYSMCLSRFANIAPHFFEVLSVENLRRKRKIRTRNRVRLAGMHDILSRSCAVLQDAQARAVDLDLLSTVTMPGSRGSGEMSHLRRWLDVTPDYTRLVCGAWYIPRR